MVLAEFVEFGMMLARFLPGASPSASFEVAPGMQKSKLARRGFVHWRISPVSFRDHPDGVTQHEVKGMTESSTASPRNS